MKICKTCRLEKDFSDFHKRKVTNDGLAQHCKGCVKIYQKRHRKVKPKGTRWTLSLYDKGLKYCRSCDEVKELSSFAKNKSNFNGLAVKCKVCKRKCDAEYRQSLRDAGVYKERKRKEYLDNIEQYREYGLDYNRNKRDYKREHQRVLKNRGKNPLAKLKNALRNRILVAIKNSGYKKNIKTEEMLGAKWDIVKRHIENQFTEGMCWGNHGEWHIDHIVSLKNATTEAELIELNHYTNLQPLWATTREVNGILYEGNLNKG